MRNILCIHDSKDSKEIMSGFVTEEFTEERFHSLLQGYEVGLEQLLLLLLLLLFLFTKRIRFW